MTDTPDRNEQPARDTTPDFTKAWKEQEMTIAEISLDDIKASDQALTRQVTMRNLLEYVAGGFVALVLGSISVVMFLAGGGLAGFMIASGMALIVAGLIVVLAVLHIRSRENGIEGDAAGVDGAAYLSRRLSHQRDLLQSVWLWYIGPLVPGFVVLYGSVIVIADGARSAPAFIATITVAFFGFVIWLNRRAAGQLQAEIDRLDRERQ